MSQLTYISLFSGIGGMDLGLDRAGMLCVAQVEIDDYCRKVLAKHWPEVPKYADVREVGRHNLPDADLICGGFPCQDISNAGKRAGIDGERSGLWSEYYRIICEICPRYVLVENVAALLNRGIDRVLGDLAACGYDAEWDCIPAAAVGAPHIRDRLFIVAHTQHRGLQKRRRVVDFEPELPVEGRVHRHEPSGGTVEATTLLADTVVECLQRQRPEGKQISETFGSRRIFSRSCGNVGEWTTEPDVGRVANGIPARVDRLKGLGNAVVPQVAEYIGNCIVRFDAAQRLAA